MTDTVGWPAAVLHSMNAPGEGAFLGKPVPVIETSAFWAKPVSGLTVIEGPDEADAASAVPLRAAPTMRAAKPIGPRRLAALVIHLSVVILLRSTFPPASVRRSVDGTGASVTLRRSPGLAHPSSPSNQCRPPVDAASRVVGAGRLRRSAAIRGKRENGPRLGDGYNAMKSGVETPLFIRFVAIGFGVDYPKSSEPPTIVSFFRPALELHWANSWVSDRLE